VPHGCRQAAFDLVAEHPLEEARRIEALAKKHAREAAASMGITSGDGERGGGGGSGGGSGGGGSAAEALAEALALGCVCAALVSVDNQALL